MTCVPGLLGGLVAWVVLAAFASPVFAQAGLLDTTFGGDGKVTTDFTSRQDGASGIAIQPVGKIVAAGVAGYEGSNPKFAVARYNTDGTLDTTFAGDGKMSTDFTSREDWVSGIAIQPDGKIVAAGFAGLRSFSSSNSMFAVARYDTDGTLDPTFGGDGRVITDFTPRDDLLAGFAIQADGKILVSGGAGVYNANPKLAVARYNIDGTLDNTFSGTAR
jgi:serralysin